MDGVNNYDTTDQIMAMNSIPMLATDPYNHIRVSFDGD